MDSAAAQDQALRRSWRSSGLVPAVLLGGPDLLRPLGMAGIPVIVLSSNPLSVSFQSRYCTAHHLLPRRDDMAGLAESIETLGERLARIYAVKLPLFYGDDYYLELIQHRRQSLSRYFSFILNDPPVAEALIHKERFHELAEGAGLPVPRALDWTLLPDITTPVIVKPKSKVHWDRSRELRTFLGTKARVFESGQALASLQLEESLREQLVIQEFVPGDDQQIVSFHGLSDEDGRLIACFTGRKVRTFPPVTGESSFLELTRDDELMAFGQEVAGQIPLKGPYKIDIKRHSQTGAFYILEVNARFNLWHYLGAKNGVNLPAATYEYLVHGRRCSAKKAGTSYRWLSLGLDYQAYQALAEMGRLSLTQWTWSLLKSRKIYHSFSWDDPMPFVVYHSRRLKRLPSRLGRLIR